MLILVIPKFWPSFMGIRFWKFHSDFEIAWIASICVGVLISKSPNVYVLIRWSFWYAKLGVLIWFHVNPRNFNPRKIHFLDSFPNGAHKIGIKRCEIILRIFWCMWQGCREMPTYPNAYAKVKKLIFHVEFPGNWFEFGIILNDFLSSTIWSIQIKVWRIQVKNPKMPGIQPKHSA